MSDAERWLLEAQQGRVEAADRYEAAIEYAVEQGWYNTKIAKVLGVSETAIRNYRKRKGIK